MVIARSLAMQRALGLITAAVTLAFVAGRLGYAVRHNGDSVGLTQSFALQGSPPGAPGIAELYLQPQHPAMWLLQICVLVAVLILGIRALSPGAMSPADKVLLCGTLLLGLIWPQVALTAPLVGFLSCLTMLLGVVAVSRQRGEEADLSDMPSFGVLAGWTTVVTFAAFASYLTTRVGIPAEIASFAAMLLLCGAATAIQLRLPDNPAYTVTAVLALLATAAAELEQSPITAVISVMGLAALTFLLVRVTT